MSVFTFAPMRHALPRVAPISQPQPKMSLQLPSFTGMRLSKAMPLQTTGKLLQCVYPNFAKVDLHIVLVMMSPSHPFPPLPSQNWLAISWKAFRTVANGLP